MISHLRSFKDRKMVAHISTFIVKVRKFLQIFVNMNAYFSNSKSPLCFLVVIFQISGHLLSSRNNFRADLQNFRSLPTPR